MAVVRDQTTSCSPAMMPNLQERLVGVKGRAQVGDEGETDHAIDV